MEDRIAEQLQATPDHGNSEDCFAVALTIDDETVDIPREQTVKDSVLFYLLFYPPRWKTHGRHRRSPVLQGGLAIPCMFTVEGPLRLLQRVRELLR